MSKSPFPTPLVIKITMGAASALSLGPVLVTYSTPVFPQMIGDDTQAKDFSNINLNWRTLMTGSSRSDVHSSPKNSPSRDESSASSL